MARASGAIGAIGIALVILGGCTIPDQFRLNYFQSGGSARDQVVAGSLETVSTSTRSGLEQLGCKVDASPQGADLRLLVKTKLGEEFAVVFTRVTTEQGERTRVHVEANNSDHEKLVFNLLSQGNAVR
jgi:hypothetical protein